MKPLEVKRINDTFFLEFENPDKTIEELPVDIFKIHEQLDALGYNLYVITGMEPYTIGDFLAVTIYNHDNGETEIIDVKAFVKR